jgi:hypothetical protein
VSGNPLGWIDPAGQNPALAARGAWWVGTSLGGAANAAIGAALGTSLGLALYEICNPNDKRDCMREIQACIKTCTRAKHNPNQRGVWGGSWWVCLTGCVPGRCQKYIDENDHDDPERRR